jgi:formate hydrogenlyase transcriptional activator
VLITPPIRLLNSARTPRFTERLRQLGLTPENLLELLESAPDAMVICKTDGVILAANGQATQLLVCSQIDLVGENIQEYIADFFRNPPGFSPEGDFAARRCALVAIRKDGTEIPIEISVGRMEAKEGELVLGIFHRPDEAANCTWPYQIPGDFEQVLSKLSAKFINLAPDLVDGEIMAGLGALAEVIGLDRVSIAVLDDKSDDLIVTHSWARPGTRAFPAQSLRLLLPWLASRLKTGEPLFAAAPEDLPQDAQAEKLHMAAFGLKSTMVIPFLVGGKVTGGMACSRVLTERPWSPMTISRFKTAANVFASALARKRADERLCRAYTEIQELKDRLEIENSYLRQEIKLEQSHNHVIGESNAMRGVLKKAEQVAKTDSTVLILGETGTGKELIARTIHEMSGRSKRSMVKANCAALPATLIESELFGRERGAYTGALTKEIGRFELADQSTLFLDEIGELPADVQSKLLRFLQEGEFERLGCSKTIKVDVRVIAATNRDLQSMVKEGKFREDLFYRLNVFPIVVPPLRERFEDIPALVWHILKEMGLRMGRKIEGVHTGTMVAFQRYSWPGNVRELRNVIERNLILNTGPIFRAELLELKQKTDRTLRHLDEIESEHFRSVLQATGWRIRGRGGAAERLGLKPTTLEARIKKLGIHRP